MKNEKVIVDNIMSYINSQDNFIKIGMFIGVGMFIVFVGYQVGAFLGRNF